jgi:succinoglycan biosynthesis protein ExoA
MNAISVDVSILVPCRNEAAHIENCVRSILAQDSGDSSFEVIVADGMSDDGTREILKQLAAEDNRIQVVDNPLEIVSAALNAAIRAAHGRIIIRMDAHTEYAVDYVKQCLLVLEATGADNVGGPWIARGEGYIGRAISAAFQSPFAVGGARGHNPEYEGQVDTVYLGCWRRELFDRAGYFDEELVRNQDDEFNLRLVRSGARIWQSPRIRSCYHPRASLVELFRQYQQYGYWKVRVIQKHRLPASIRHLIPASFVAALLILTLAAPFGELPAYALTTLISAYAITAIAAAAVTAAQHGFVLLPVLPLIYACYHFSYGLGFLRGIWDFLVIGRASKFANKLTRSSKSIAAGRIGAPTGKTNHSSNLRHKT